jgi:hypothetical protein
MSRWEVSPVVSGCPMDANIRAGPEKGWLAFQGYYDEQLAKTNGSFLK